MYANITSVGKFLPKNIIKNSEFENFLDTTDEWIKSRTGIEDTLPAPKIKVILDLLFSNLLAKPLYLFI